MRSAKLALFNLFPLHFRILFRLFLLRIIDLEALSLQADIPRFLGQFAGVLIMLSLVQLPIAFGYAVSGGALTFAWHVQQALISTMMLVVGLFTVISWDATFPDRRDVLVLAPLPVASHSILTAKLAASGCVVALAIVALNVVSGVIWPLLFAVRRGTLYAAAQTLVAYWLTMVLASIFLYAAVLTVQGLSALLLPRRAFLRVSALLQLGAFVLFLSVYFLQPVLTTPVSIMAPQNSFLVAWSPTFWFFALFHQLSGTLPSSLYWLAHRAWNALALAFAGAIGSLLLSYLRTMRQTVQESDLVATTSGSHRASERGDPLTCALLHFSLRALIRSRQHRVALAFYAALVFSIVLSLVKSTIGTQGTRPISVAFLICSLLIMTLTVVGFRGVYALPISLTANWILRVTQVRSSRNYLAFTRRSLLLLAVMPAWFLSGLLALEYRPWSQIVSHLIILAFFGSLVVDLCLLNFNKAPFTCSYLPGKSNVQFVFWGAAALLLLLFLLVTKYEVDALSQWRGRAELIGTLATAAAFLRLVVLQRTRSATLYFEDFQPEEITALKLISGEQLRSESLNIN